VAATENHLIELLPPADRERLLAQCETVDLVLSAIVCEAGMPTRYAFFPLGGFISLVAPIDGRPGLEVGMVGREGMLGSQLALGVETAPLRALVQGVGTARRIESAAFRRELRRSAALRHTMERYLYVLMAQLASSAACLRFHLIGPRLARWLLMSQDRAHADQFPLTQEFVATMLGVRRVGVTGAAGALQRRGLIQYHRGALTVVDRPGLLAAACSCYAADTQVYQQTLAARR